MVTVSTSQITRNFLLKFESRVRYEAAKQIAQLFTVEETRMNHRTVVFVYAGKSHI